jgi:hypothetical protein
VHFVNQPLGCWRENTGLQDADMRMSLYVALNYRLCVLALLCRLTAVDT